MCVAAADSVKTIENDSISCLLGKKKSKRERERKSYPVLFSDSNMIFFPAFLDLNLFVCECVRVFFLQT